MTADHAGQTGGEREVCGSVHNLSGTWSTNPPSSARCYRALGHDGQHHNPAGVMWGATLAPVPPSGQAAREAAVEAVAEHVRHWLGGWMEAIRNDQKPTTTRTLARELLALDEVAALSAAPVQEPLHEWACPACGATTRARMADQDDDHGDCFEVCQGHPGQEQS